MDTSFDLLLSSLDEFASRSADVLAGRLVGTVCKGYVSHEICAELFDRFRTHPDIRTRQGDAYGKYLGTFHWRKEKSDYLDECQSYGSAVAGFSPEWDRCLEVLRRTISADGKHLRRAIWDNVQSAVPIVRSWRSVDAYALIPHEDASQCADPIQVGFEIQDIAPRHPICSLNLCIENAGGGELVIWNRIPTEPEKVAFGTERDGGPYPLSYVNNSAFVKLAVERGDLYMFNGQYIHAVTSSVSARATISCLLGRVPSGDVVMWT